MTIVYYCYLEGHGSIKETKVTVGQTLNLRSRKKLSKLRDGETADLYQQKRRVRQPSCVGDPGN